MGKNNANQIMHLKKIIMQYCNKSLIKNNNEIALVMHQHALLDMSDWE